MNPRTTYEWLKKEQTLPSAKDGNISTKKKLPQ